MAVGKKTLEEFGTALRNVYCRTDGESGEIVDTRQTNSADVAMGLLFASGDNKTRRQANETVELACMVSPSDTAAIFSGCAWVDTNGEIRIADGYPLEAEFFAILQKDPKGKKLCKKVADILAAAEREPDLKPLMCRSIKRHAKETK